VSTQTTTPSPAEPAGPAGTTGRKRGAPALLPASARRPAAVIALCCAAIVLVLAILVAHISGPVGPDQAVDSWLKSWLGGHDRLLVLLMDPGEPIQSVVLTAVVTAACLVARRLEGAVLTIVSSLLASGIAELVLKPLVDRKLSPWPDPVYPSGHTCRAFALAAVLVVLLLSQRRRTVRPAVKIVIAALLFLGGCAVGVAVICLDFHYFTDTIGGAALGVGVVIATAFALDSTRVRSRLAPLAERLERQRGSARA
jgi:membrane-associated phospholipid phosphatase